MKVIWKAIWHNVNTKFTFPIWAYLLLPVFAIGLEVIGAVPKILINLILEPTETVASMMKIPALIEEVFKKIGG